MTISNIISLLENNYDEINVFDFINEQIKQDQADPSIYAAASLSNEAHKLTIQALIWRPDENHSGENSDVYQIYIDYSEDDTNKIQKAFRYTDSEKEKLSFMDLINIDSDMGWITI